MVFSKNECSLLSNQIVKDLKKSLSNHMHAHILFHKLKCVTEAKAALTAFHEDLKWYLTTLEIKTQQQIPHLLYVFVNKFLLTRPADYIDFP